MRTEVHDEIIRKRIARFCERQNYTLLSVKEWQENGERHVEMLLGHNTFGDVVYMLMSRKQGEKTTPAAMHPLPREEILRWALEVRDDPEAMEAWREGIRESGRRARQ